MKPGPLAEILDLLIAKQDEWVKEEAGLERIPAELKTLEPYMTQAYREIVYDMDKRSVNNILQSFTFDSSNYQNELVGAIAPLTEAQLSARPVAHLRSVGEMAEHIVRARALWLPRAGGALGEALARMANWDEPSDPPRSAPRGG